MSLNIAIAWAHANPVTGLPKMAAVLTDGRAFFVGLNSRKTHPLQKRFSKHPEAQRMHAEIAAIAKACNDLSRKDDLSSFKLYVARVTRHQGALALAQPCPGCMRAIKHFKIKHVQWT